MNTKTKVIPEAVSQKVDKFVSKKMADIIDMKEKIDKRFGTFKPNKYKVEIKTIQEEENKNAEDNIKQE